MCDLDSILACLAYLARMLNVWLTWRNLRRDQMTPCSCAHSMHAHALRGREDEISEAPKRAEYMSLAQTPEHPHHRTKPDRNRRLGSHALAGRPLAAIVRCCRPRADCDRDRNDADEAVSGAIVRCGAAWRPSHH